jgi:putative oxidoreductase
MANQKPKQLLQTIITSLLVLLWSYTALSKWAEPAEFAQSLASQPLPGQFSDMLFWMIPAAELLAAAMLLFPSTKRKGMLLSMVLLAAFTGYVSLALSGAFGQVPCSCGGALEGMGWKTHLLFNLFFLSAALIGYRITP